MVRRPYQFSLRSFLAFVALCALTAAVPHVVAFTLSFVLPILALRAAYRSMRRGRPRLGLILASIVGWAVFYILSIGPFIVFSELDKRMTGRYHLGRLVNAYRPVRSLLFRRGMEYPFYYLFVPYVNAWIPPDADGLSAMNPVDGLQPFVGTWTGESGNVLNFRPDGTARWRSTPGEKLGYLEWTLDPKQLAIYQYAKRRSYTAWFGRVLLNLAPTNRMSVVDISDKQFRVRDTSGKTLLFIRTADSELESAP